MFGYIIILVVLVCVFALITGPLRVVHHRRSDLGVTIADLEAARNAKFQEIHDSRMDLETGKLSVEDHREIDGALRAEAIEILHRLDRTHAEEAAAAHGADARPGASDPGPELPSAP
jgi:hypothetical protein